MRCLLRLRACVLTSGVRVCGRMPLFVIWSAACVCGVRSCMIETQTCFTHRWTRGSTVHSKDLAVSRTASPATAWPRPQRAARAASAAAAAAFHHTMQHHTHTHDRIQNSALSTRRFRRTLTYSYRGRIPTFCQGQREVRQVSLSPRALEARTSLEAPPRPAGLLDRPESCHHESHS